MTNEAKEVKKLFPGSVLIIDDDINKGDAETYEIIAIANYLEANGYHVIREWAIPTEQEFKDMSFSFIILDWKFSPKSDVENARDVIAFLQIIYKYNFVPTFICSTVPKTTIEGYLVGEPLYKTSDASCIKIVDKGLIKGNAVFEAILNWVNANPSIHVMKNWEQTIEKARIRMFNEMYKASEHWPNIIFQSFNADCGDASHANQEMGNFITKNLLSRIEQFNFNLSTPTIYESTKEVLSGERLQRYNNVNITTSFKFHTGDIIQINDEFFINIKRQCDLIRSDNKNLYLLKCNKLTISPFVIQKDGFNVKILDGSSPNGTSVLNWNLTADDVINKKINKALSKTKAIHHNKILEQSNEIIIPCLLDGGTYSIDLKNLSIKLISELVGDQNVQVQGRLLAPYINAVLHKFSLYFASEGAMPIPKGIYDNCVATED